MQQNAAFDRLILYQMLMHTDFRRLAEKSIDELERRIVTPPFATGMIASIARARAVPLQALTRPQLRLLVSQRVSLVNTLPRAMQLLEETPLLEAQFYAGDLLLAVVDLGAHRIAAAAPSILVVLIERALARLATISTSFTPEDRLRGMFDLDDVDRNFLEPKLRAALAQSWRARGAV